MRSSGREKQGPGHPTPWEHIRPSQRSLERNDPEAPQGGIYFSLSFRNPESQHLSRCCYTPKLPKPVFCFFVFCFVFAVQDQEWSSQIKTITLCMCKLNIFIKLQVFMTPIVFSPLNICMTLSMSSAVYN